MIDFTNHRKWMQALPDLFSREISHLQRAGGDGDGLVTTYAEVTSIDRIAFSETGGWYLTIHVIKVSGSQINNAQC